MGLRSTFNGWTITVFPSALVTIPLTPSAPVGNPESSPRDSSHRPEDAHASLGDLDALDVALKSESIPLLKEP
jgi:hypothetical protein